jgi:hypothetical protein
MIQASAVSAFIKMTAIWKQEDIIVGHYQQSVLLEVTGNDKSL